MDRLRLVVLPTLVTLAGRLVLGRSAQEV